MKEIKNVHTDSEGKLRANFNSLRVFTDELDMYEEMGDEMIVSMDESPAGENLLWCYSKEDEEKQCYLLNK